ncbi:hypothetical protein CANINC_000304 [Pichia inconspicua]|uniref:separase n=1 Tax=Pichia inconspicua TaxID=52247 RepID=A0A4V4NG91_9ASCO|nr:hypothetical protein CANINC_000304 [[Candida] inconspicua]
MEDTTDIATAFRKLKGRGDCDDNEYIISLTTLLINHLKTQEKLPYDIISQYIDLITKMNCKAVTSDKVIDLISNLRTQKDISKLILPLIQITLKKMDQFHNIDHNDQSLLTMDKITKLKYIKLELSLLRILTETKSSVQEHLKDLVDGYTSSSIFFKCITEQHKDPIPEYFELTSIFIELSMSVKTIHRLIFLITAAHYSIYTGSPKQELFIRISKEGLKMLSKSRTMVYKNTYSLLHQLNETCKERNISTTHLDDLLKEFETQTPIERNSNEKINSKDIIQPLNEMSISLTDIPTNTTIGVPNLKSLDFNDLNDLKSAYKYVSGLSDGNDYKLSAFQFDIIMMNCKRVDINNENAVLVHTILNTTFNFFNKDGESKRLRNCSKLFFYHGNKLLKQNPIASLPFWESFISCEKQLATNQLDLQITQKRLNFITSNEMDASNFEIAMHIQLMFVNKTISNRLHPQQYIELLKQNYGPFNILQTILKSHYLALKRLKSKTEYSDYEFQIIEMLIQTLRYHELFNYSSELINLYLTNRKKYLSVSKLATIYSMLLDSQLCLDQYDLGESTITQNNYYLEKKVETFEEMDFALNTLRFTAVSQSKHSSKLMEKIYDTFTTSERFSISKQTEQYSAVNLLILYAKFCQIVGESWDSTNIRSVSNFTRSITIFQSIFKNFLLPGSNASTLNVCFKYTLKMKFSYMMLECYNGILQKYSCLGFAKEINYYLNELSAFITIQPSLNIQYNYNLKLMEFYLLKNAVDEASIYYQKIKQQYETIICDDNLLLEINSLVAIENYARKSKDMKLALTATQKLDNTIFNYLKSRTTTPYKYHTTITKWIEAIKRRYQYLCEGDLNDYKLAIDKNILLYVEYHNCLKDLKEKTLSGLICCYPMVDNDSLECASSENFKRLKTCNDKLVIDFENSFNNSSVELASYTLNMIITSFVNMLNCDKKVEIHEELSKLVSVNDNFKYASFLSEKLNASTNFKKNQTLPEITDDIFKLDQNLTMSLSCNISEILPANWTIITIDYVPSINSLMITKQTKEFKKPLFINLTLDSSDGKASYENIQQELKDIVEESDRTTHFEVTSKIKTMDQKIQWWETRKNLDARLERLLLDIDEHWFGGFNSIFNPLNGSTEDFRYVKKCIKSMLSTAQVSVEVINSVDQLHPGIFQLFLNTDEIKSTSKLRRLLKLLFEMLDQKQIISDENILKKSMLQLKKDIMSTKSRPKQSENGHIVLIPGNGCLNLPWESIPSLRKRSVTRMPTLQQLKLYLTQYKNLLDDGISSDTGYYVINPGGDLKRTEENLAPKFKFLDGWNGVIGAPPTEMELMKAFDTNGLYIYAGHGGGEQFVKSKTIKARNKIPPTLLLGCSSGALKGEGFVYPYGTAYNYIMGGCPMLLVNLWDVTDKDIDTFTVEMLTNWGFFVDYDSLDPFDLNATSETLPESVAKSRDICKLKYLNGAAPVVYGLPLRLESNQ